MGNLKKRESIKQRIPKTKNSRSGPFETQLSGVKRSCSWDMNGATTSTLMVSRFNGSLVGDVFMIAGSKKQGMPVGF